MKIDFPSVTVLCECLGDLPLDMSRRLDFAVQFNVETSWPFFQLHYPRVGYLRVIPFIQSHNVAHHFMLL